MTLRGRCISSKCPPAANCSPSSTSAPDDLPRLIRDSALSQLLMPATTASYCCVHQRTSLGHWCCVDAAPSSLLSPRRGQGLEFRV
mmetsp:Transcript_34094/g.75618  ORF Transcript_34094/g.75618 Transcript_34094/m.75618 type:complete len:86 (+) Transcript_34094:507-764(+)